ncbi:hypothetical protein LCGC14_1824450 [marine sediment metagenome]|uniref:Transmembrane protein n=1 Tax=marine sediment metagenome TaxID=412755 RepID=A0A0F9EXR7_9ZZZZ
MKDKWKTIAIIFIVLFILETILFISLIKMGFNVQEEENICLIEICSDYDSYYYDPIQRICSCYVNGQVEYQEYLNS